MEHMTKDPSPEQVLGPFLQHSNSKAVAKLLQLQSLKTYLPKIAGTASIKVRFSYICIASRFTLYSPSNMQDSQILFIPTFLGLFMEPMTACRPRVLARIII